MIRNYKPSDLEQCRLLWIELTQHHRELYDDPTIGGDDPGQFFDEHLAEVGPENVWIADEDGIVVGMACLTLTGEESEIEPVIVKSGYQNQGVGRSLVRHITQHAEKLGIRYLSVKPVARNKSAITFFYNMGFRKLGHVQMFMELNPSKQSKWERDLTFLGHNFEY